MLPAFFLSPENQDGGKSTVYYIMLSRLRALIRLLLPMQKHTLVELAKQITRVLNRNHRTYESHRKKRLHKFSKKNN